MPQGTSGAGRGVLRRKSDLSRDPPGVTALHLRARPRTGLLLRRLAVDTSPVAQVGCRWIPAHRSRVVPARVPPGAGLRLPAPALPPVVAAVPSPGAFRAPLQATPPAARTCPPAGSSSGYDPPRRAAGPRAVSPLPSSARPPCWTAEGDPDSGRNSSSNANIASSALTPPVSRCSPPPNARPAPA
jgi:hypothetical protein